MFVELFRDYGEALVQAGYNGQVLRVSIFARSRILRVWLELEGVALKSIDDRTVMRFDQHRSSCNCPGTSSDIGRRAIYCNRGFLAFLRAKRIVRTNAASAHGRLVRESLGWMSTQRSDGNTTINPCRRYALSAPERTRGSV